MTRLYEPLRLAMAVLTYNRIAMLMQTLSSLGAGLYRAEPQIEWHLTVVDNGSHDGTQDWVAEMPAGYCNRDGNVTVGHGMNLAISRALVWEPDIVLFTADDYRYAAGWADKLAAFWGEAPAEVALVCCNLEPDYDWNKPSGVIEAGGQRALARASVPGSNWSFRAKDWPAIGPLVETTGGEDLAVCKRLRGQGRVLCAMDLTEHIGERASAWGNGSWRVARPLDRERWGI